MKTGTKKIHKIIYVLDSHRVLNDRVEKLVSLREKFDKMILVKSGRERTAGETILINPKFNPTSILLKLGLHKLDKLLDRYVFFPSSTVFFVKSAIKRLHSEIRRDFANASNVCLITCLPPHDLVLAGLSLKRYFPQLEWIIDWQDLWSYDENYYERNPKYYRKKMLKLESDALSASDINITTNHYAKHVLEAHYNVPAERIVSINHHFSRDDMPVRLLSEPCVSMNASNKIIKIGFLGTLFKTPRVPGEKIVEAVKYVRRKGLEVELHVYGNLPKFFERMSREKPFEGLVMHGNAGHKESLENIAQYDFLLLVLSDLPNCRAVMSIKLPHYLMVGKPIIAVVPDPSAVADIVRETGSGYVIPSNSDWGEALTRMLESYKQGNQFLERNEQAINAFSWENISNQWLDLLYQDHRVYS